VPRLVSKAYDVLSRKNSLCSPTPGGRRAVGDRRRLIEYFPQGGVARLKKRLPRRIFVAFNSMPLQAGPSVSFLQPPAARLSAICDLCGDIGEVLCSSGLMPNLLLPTGYSFEVSRPSHAVQEDTVPAGTRPLVPPQPPFQSRDAARGE